MCGFFDQLSLNSNEVNSFNSDNSWYNNITNSNFVSTSANNADLLNSSHFRILSTSFQNEYSTGSNIRIEDSSNNYFHTNEFRNNFAGNINQLSSYNHVYENDDFFSGVIDATVAILLERSNTTIFRDNGIFSSLSQNQVSIELITTNSTQMIDNTITILLKLILKLLN